MDHNFAPPSQRRKRGGMAAYLLGMGPMPPPRPEEIAVARAMYYLDRPEVASGDNIEPPLRAEAGAMGQNDPQVTVRVPIDHKLTRDIKVPTGISHDDFFDRICAAMDVDPKTTRLGWKSNDESKRSPAHQLLTEDEMKDAFRTVLNMMRNPRRYKEVVMEIIPLNTPSVQEAKNNQTKRLSYTAALRTVQDRLSCTQHAESNRWCYVNPKNPNTHLPIGKEEVCLWARKIVRVTLDPSKENQLSLPLCQHDLEALPDCIKPPYCLRLDTPSPAGEAQTLGMQAAAIPPIHIHVNNQVFASSSSSLNVAGMQQGGLKRRHSVLSDSGDGESDLNCILLADILEGLHLKFPKLDFPQCTRILNARGILYAENAVHFDREYFVQAGLSEGAAASLLAAIGKAVCRKQRRGKRTRVSLKENGM